MAHGIDIGKRIGGWMSSHLEAMSHIAGMVPSGWKTGDFSRPA